MKENCLTCKYLKADKGILRCEMFDNAIIDNPKEKQCEDSIYPGYEQISYTPPINKTRIC